MNGRRPTRWKDPFYIDNLVHCSASGRLSSLIPHSRLLAERIEIPGIIADTDNLTRPLLLTISGLSFITRFSTVLMCTSGLLYLRRSGAVFSDQS